MIIPASQKPRRHFRKKRKINLENPTESSVQYAFLKWLKAQYPYEEKLTFSIPNGGKRDIIYAKRLQREGLKAHMPDLCMLIPRNPYHGLLLECKRKGKVLRDGQKEMLDLLEKEGYKTGWFDTLDKGIEIVKAYLGKPWG